MPWPTQRRILGTKVQRLDGPEKATGRAKYSFDVNRPGMIHARMLRSPHAHAVIKSIDTQAAEKTPGFKALFPIAKPGDDLNWCGQEILAIAADTEEHAEDCLRAIKVEFQVLPFAVKEEDSRKMAEGQGTVDGKGANAITGGDFETDDFAQKAYAGNPVIVETTLGVNVISHQCLESHGLVAEWDKDQKNLTVWASTQAVPITADQLAKRFNIPATQVQCITHYMGGGFGSKFGPDIQGIAAAELARLAKAPVKLMLDRAEEVTVGGQRPSAFGKVKIAAAKDGKVQAFEVDCYGSPGVGKGATVNFNLLPYVYTTIPNIKRKHQIVRMNIQIARAMRAPGHPQNCLLTDQAFDELAAALNMNPMDFRLKNLPPNDEPAIKNAPTSYLAIRNTLYTTQIGLVRKMSDWDKRWHPPGKSDGVIKKGVGMALHTWGGGGRGSNITHITISPDGSVLVQSSSQDLGTAQRTVQAIIVAELLGLQPSDITIQLGESQFGASTPSGGSTTCPGSSAAVLKAAENVREVFLAALSVRLKANQADLSIEPGVIVNKANNEKIAWKAACAKLGMNAVQASGDWPNPKEMTSDEQLRTLWTSKITNQGVGGVQVAEVEVDTETGVVKCTNVWAVQDVGLVVNKLACESQAAGGVIMGVNYALFEESIFDRHTGRQVNPDMEFYKLGGIIDMPNVHIHMMDMPERGVIGIGEPPTISTAAAVGNAIFNAIGVRVPHAPFTPERVLAALANKK